MGSCNSFAEKYKKPKTKLDISKKNSKLSDSFSSSVPDLSSLIFIPEDDPRFNLKKYNSMEETNSLQNNRYNRIF